VKDGLIYSSLLKLRCLEGQPRPDRQAYRGLAMVLALLREHHPQVAEALHKDAQDKPLTVSPLLRDKKGEDSWCLRLTVLDQELFGALADAVLGWDPEGVLTLGASRFLLQGLETMPGADPRVACVSYSQLIESVPPGELRWQLDFLTPTSFRSKGGYSPFPAVPLVFGSLARRWSRFSPVPLPPGLTGTLEQAVGVAEYRLGLTRLGFGGYFEPGFTGWCAFTARKQTGLEFLRWTGALARFAQFSGVGAKTAMGMGQARFQSGGEGLSGKSWL
jgi:CRISPR-associated endoribonuclease Cas6